MNNESQPFKSLNISVLIISDTRTVSSDKSGKILEDRINESGHSLVSKLYVKDEPTLIKEEISKILKEKKTHVIISSGGTGLTGRDSTPEVLRQMITKEIPLRSVVEKPMTKTFATFNGTTSRVNISPKNNKIRKTFQIFSSFHCQF